MGAEITQRTITGPLIDSDTTNKPPLRHVRLTFVDAHTILRGIRILGVIAGTLQWAPNFNSPVRIRNQKSLDVGVVHSSTGHTLILTVDYLSRYYCRPLVQGLHHPISVQILTLPVPRQLSQGTLMVAPVILGMFGSGFLITPVPPHTLQVTIGDILHLLLITCLSPEILLSSPHGILLRFS
jgi:hypothetical protein